MQAVEDVNVTFEDQQKINKFARNTNRMTELKNEILEKRVSVTGAGKTCFIVLYPSKDLAFN